MIPHEEYDIKIHAPATMGVCRIESCMNQGEFALFVEDDHGKLTKDIDPICPRCLLTEVLLTVMEGPHGRNG